MFHKILRRANFSLNGSSKICESKLSSGRAKTQCEPKYGSHSAFTLVACLKKVHGFDESMSRILQILSVNVFQKVSLDQLLGDFTTERDGGEFCKQLNFNDL